MRIKGTSIALWLPNLPPTDVLSSPHGANVAPLYRGARVHFETANAPFEAAGCVDVDVTPLNHDLCCEFGRSLADQGRLPQTPQDFRAQASALLCALPHTEPTRSWQISVNRTKPGMP